jgi:hypothetical protein
LASFGDDWKIQDVFKIKGGGSVHESITKEAAKLAGIPYTKELEEGVRWPDVLSTEPGETSYTGLVRLLMPERFRDTLTIQSHNGASQYWHSMARTDDDISNESVLEKIVNQAEEWYTGALQSKSIFEVGKIVHMVQDSYSASHVVRNGEGQVTLFQDYGMRPHSSRRCRQQKRSGYAVMENIPGARDAVKASAKILILYKRGVPFSEVKSHLRENVYKFAPGYENATAGGTDWKFKRK